MRLTGIVIVDDAFENALQYRQFFAHFCRFLCVFLNILSRLGHLLPFSGGTGVGGVHFNHSDGSLKIFL